MLRYLVSALLLSVSALAAPLQFRAPITLQTGARRLGGFVTADFNGDGHPDFAITDQYGTSVTVYLNKGDGTFAAPVSTPLSIPNTTGALVTGDFNEDGHTDLLVATISGLQADILLLGKGDGTFTQSTSIPGSHGFLSGAVADFNNDGHLDLVDGGNGSLYFFLGDGHGNFQLQPFSNQGSSGSYAGLAIADFNGDGRLDFVASLEALSGSSNLRFFRGNGDGTFAAPVDIPQRFFSQPASLQVADLTSDGKPDLLLNGTAGTVLLPGNGDGSFNLTHAAGVCCQFDPFPAPIPAAYGGSYIPEANAAIADMDRDGKLDVVVTSPGGPAVEVLLNDGTGTFPQTAPDFRGTIPADYSQVLLTDLNGDGLPDILVGNSGGTVTVFLSSRVLQTPAVSISSTAPTQLAGAPVTVSVSVAGSSPVPSDTVTLTDGATTLGSKSLDSSGIAIFSLTSLSTGNHNLTAAYAGDQNYTAQSTTSPLTIALTDFTAAAPPAPQTVTRGGTAIFPVTLTPQFGFTGPITFTCSGLPAGAACSAPPVTLSGSGATTANVSVTTSPSAALSPLRPAGLLPAAASLAALCLLPCLRGRLRLTLLALVCCASFASLAGCSSSPAAVTRPAPQTTSFTITATATQSGQVVSHAIAATITLQ